MLSHAIVTFHWCGTVSVTLFTDNGNCIFFDEGGPGVEKAVLNALAESVEHHSPQPSGHKGCTVERWDFYPKVV